ncbi:ArgS-related anticodon-binding protein NrtL [Streptomyces sp. t39]|uniref:ArgS-related anticodon-binding protein NrtL n=1 Tax=Streptomyces sp. t39 TaxID=1828156 RepID=UPI0011CEC3EF|nr:DALR anticodon-binding domain-containing protein [Streptomyces sp. t39]TXS56907.1 arginine--tRNA ligase [Streptomyces sp. t39]
MTPAELSRTVARAVCRAVEEGALAVEVPEAASVRVERPRPGGTGDWATGIALRLAGPAGRPPREVAGVLCERIARTPGVARVEITGPGFLNVTLEGGAQRRLVEAVRAAGTDYGMPERRAPRTPFIHLAEERAALWAGVLGRMGAEARPGEELRVVPAARPGLVAELGADAARWALLSAAAHDRPRTGGVLVQHERNPLHKVRYAHARARALTRGAQWLGFTAAPEEIVDAPALTQAVADHPAVVADAARLRAPDRLARHLEATAEALLAFQHTVLPVGDEKPSAAHRSRLALAEAAGTVLAGGLSLLGISAPEHL